MRNPGWYTMTPNKNHEPGIAAFTMRIKRWHPGFWLCLLRSLWAGTAHLPAIIRPLVVIAATVYALIRTVR